MSETSPIAVLAGAAFGGCHLERVFIRADLEEAIRLSDRRPGRFNRRLLCLSEEELLVLLGDAAAAGVFSQDFLDELRAVLDAQEAARYASRKAGREASLSYYVSHMTPHKRARIHEGSCKHCRDGQGQENQLKNNSGATGWSPPLATLKEAEIYMEREFPRFTDKGKCSYCIPKVGA